MRHHRRIFGNLGLPRLDLDSPLVGKWGGGFSPLDLFAGGADGAYYPIWEEGVLFQDVAGTTPATEVDDEVRLIKDPVNGNDLSILTTATPGILKIIGGKRRVRCGVGAAFKTTNNKNLQLPLYICAGLSTPTVGSASLFGVIRSAINVHAIRPHTIQNRVTGWLHDETFGIANPISPYNTAPLNALFVADSRAVVGETDIRINGVETIEGFEANSWDGTAQATNAVYGINMVSSTAANPSQSVDFAGGLILHANLSETMRANTVAYVRDAMEHTADPTDNVLLVLGDSTGDGWPGSVDATEWPWLLAQKLAADDATAYIGIRLYEENNFSYGPEVVVQEGTGGPAWRVWNGSVAGRTPQFHTGAHFKTAVADVPEPSVVIWNHGHNIAATSGATTTSFAGRFIGPMEMVRLQFPGAPHMAVLQNPWRTSTTMTNLVAEVAAVAALYGDMPTADVHQAYLDFDPSKDSTLYAGGTDNIHPSDAGVELFETAINAMWDANWPMDPGAPAFLATTATNLLTNGRFTGGLTTGWTTVGDGVVSSDTAIVDAGDSTSIKIVNGATAATLLRQTLDATPYQGGSVTLAVRQYVHLEAGDVTAGQIRISSNGTGTPSVANFAGLTSQGSGGWRWMVVSLDVPADATTITVDLQASNVAGVDDGTVNYGRAVLVAGDEPRNVA